MNVLDVVKLRSRQVIQDKSKFSVLGDCKKQCTSSWEVLFSLYSPNKILVFSSKFFPKVKEQAEDLP